MRLANVALAFIMLFTGSTAHAAMGLSGTPDISSLSTGERIALSSVCSNAQRQGPAAYNQCVRDQLAAIGSDRTPDAMRGGVPKDGRKAVKHDNKDANTVVPQKRLEKGGIPKDNRKAAERDNKDTDKVVLKNVWRSIAGSVVALKTRLEDATAKLVRYVGDQWAAIGPDRPPDVTRGSAAKDNRKVTEHSNKDADNAALKKRLEDEVARITKSSEALGTLK